MIIGSQLSKRKYLLSFLLLSSIEVVHSPLVELSCRAEHLTNEEIAIKALRDENPVSVWTDYEVTVREKSPSCIRSSKLYEVAVKGMNPPLISLVAIGEDKIPYVFPEYKAYQHHDRFSRVIAKEGVNIAEDNIVPYINMLLSLLDVRSYLIHRIDEVEYLPDYIKSDLNKYAEEVKDPQLRVESKKASMVFYAWYRWGTLRKWKLDVALNGEILCIEVTDLATYKMGIL
jgi:hypothetical protein